MKYAKPEMMALASALCGIESGSQKPSSNVQDAAYPIDVRHTNGAYEADE